ncbi:hypothetical protein C9374_007252 [Naegleria lovaniensis]|uniref:mitogen-activated protein kinase kinase n=1 Tax=Naegleria lovaniensis TaxID=51637 RepID=A0AA88H4S4_NAELO|nr:uncharacterized protein C9374_007252 [Naegleria lovaniensis]KAG2393721.1 hypothetical protein C9374_007252 [Naegleria lovaniensis]
MVLEKSKQKSSTLKYATEELKKNKEIVIEAVKQNGSTLIHAAEELKKDKEIVLEAVKQNGSALEYAAEELKKDKQFILEAVKQKSSTLIYAAEELKKDKEIVFEAVKQDGTALEYAAEELKKDKQFILEVVKQDGVALGYAAEELKKDKEIVFEAVKRNGISLEYAAKELKKDKEIVFEAVKQDGTALEYAAEELKKDKEIVLEAMKQNSYALMYAAEELKKDKQFILEVVKQDGIALGYAVEELKNDREIVLEAVKQNGSALMYAAEELKKDREIVFEAVNQDGTALEYAAERFKKDKEIIFKAVKQNGLALEYASERFKKDNILVLEAVKQNGFALIHAAEELKKDKDVVFEAVKQVTLNLASTKENNHHRISQELNDFISEDLAIDDSFKNEVDRIIDMSIQVCSQEVDKEKRYTLLNQKLFHEPQPTKLPEQMSSISQPTTMSPQPSNISQRLVIKLEDEFGTRMSRVTIDSNNLFLSLMEQVKNSFIQLQDQAMTLTYFDPTFGDMDVKNDHDVKDCLALFQDSSLENKNKFIKVHVTNRSHKLSSQHSIGSSNSTKDYSESTQSFQSHETKRSDTIHSFSSQHSMLPGSSFGIHSAKNVCNFESNDGNISTSTETLNSSPTFRELSIIDKYLKTKYEQIVFIDNGGFGNVYRVVDLKTKKCKALKQLQVDNPSTLNDAFKEALTMAKMKHVNIVQIYDAFIPNITSRVCIEMELMQGSLKSLFIDKKIRLSENILRQLTKQVCEALDWMFSEYGILHRDIKPGNILVRNFDVKEETIQVALGDFGLSKSIDLISTNGSQVGTLLFMAPELLHTNFQQRQYKENKSFSVGSDMFALGVTLFQLMSMNTTTVLSQYYEMGGNDIEKFILMKIPQPSPYSTEFVELVANMLKLNPLERILPKQAISKLMQ